MECILFVVKYELILLNCKGAFKKALLTDFPFFQNNRLLNFVA
jgi:hypothetical protein